MSDRRTYQREWARKKHGHAPRKRLDNATLCAIRRRLLFGYKQLAIAVEFGISQQQVSRIKRGLAK